MRNSFCRICRTRFNLKYSPAAVDIVNKTSAISRTISIRISESGEESGNICWDCEETLLGFQKIIGEDNEEVVVDDDEILYKSLEQLKRNHCLSRGPEIIEIDDSSDSDGIEIIEEDSVIDVGIACKAIGERKDQSRGLNNQSRKTCPKTKSLNKMRSEKEDTSPRGRIFESKQCPLCSYHSGVEFEVVCHIRQNHPHYTGADLRFDYIEGDSELTRRIIFAQLWTFFECKECGKIYDRFWPHRKHITTHDRKKINNTLTVNNNITNNNNNNINNKESTNCPPKQKSNSRSLKRPLDEIVDNGRTKLFKAAKNQQSNERTKTLVVKLRKSEPKSSVDARKKEKSQSEKSKSKAILRKQQQLQARREKRRQKKEQEKLIARKAKKKPAPSKPTFKMPTQPAPRASSIVRPPVVQKVKLSLSCKLCSESFCGFIAWNSHIIRCHSPKEIDYNQKNEKVCRSCDKEFNDSNSLKSHIRVSHRRKNRKISMEVNGNDQDENCCQSEILSKSVEGLDADLSSKKSDTDHQQQNTTKDLQTCSALTKRALFCQYCSALFAPVAETAMMKDHEYNHIVNGDAKRFFVLT